MENKKKIVSFNLGGISNRVKCLVSMQRLAEKRDRGLYLYWIKNNTCGANFSDLFENTFQEIDKEDLKMINKKDIKLYGDNIADMPDPSNKYLFSDTCRFICLPGEVQDNFAKILPTTKGNNIDFEFERIPEKLRKEILKYLRNIKPKKSIKNFVDNFSKKYNLKNAIGIHIRRDDFVMGVDGLGKVSTNGKFIIKIKEILIKNPNTMFFLCTDCQKTEDQFKNKFKNKIIIFEKKNRDRTSVVNTQEGLIDLLLLSKTKQIIGTYGSTFTELAWWFGGCMADIYMVKDESLEKEYKFKRQKLEKSNYMKFKRFIATLLGKNSRFN